MAGFNYIKAQASALKLIAKFGTVTKIANVTSTYNPVTGENADEIKTITDATVVSLPGGSSITSFDKTFREQLVKGEAKFFYVAASGLDFAPEPGHVIQWEGRAFEIIGSNPLNPAEATPVMYNIGCTKSNKPTTIFTNGLWISSEIWDSSEIWPVS